MPFKNVFERRLNENMQQNGQGRAPPTEALDADMGMKKQFPPSTPDFEAANDDSEWSEKKDRPPRFSTLFGVAPPLPPRQFESYPEPKRKSGIFLPTPIFVILMVVLLFESTLLFVYTIIGLYNNLPSQFMPMASGRQCEGLEQKQPSINIAPNFVMPQAQVPVTQTVTIMEEDPMPDMLHTSTSATSRSVSTFSSPSSTSSTSSVDTTSQAAAIASEVLGILSMQSTPTTASSTSTHSIVTVTANPVSTQILSEVQSPPSTVQSTLLLTVNAAGSTLSPQPTVTSTAASDVSQAAAASSSLAASISAESSVSAAVASLSAELAPSAIPLTSTLVTSVTSTPAPPATTAAPTTVS